MEINGKGMGKCIERREKVSVKIEINYIENSIRPDSFRITYKIDGEEFIKPFQNIAGGVLDE